jgi:hypothetical protein
MEKGSGTLGRGALCAALLVGAAALLLGGCGGDDDGVERTAAPELPQLTRFQTALRRLPIRQPPLRIQSYLVTGRKHAVVALLRPEDFFCGRPPAERIAAIRALYRVVSRRFAVAGIERFGLAIGELTPRVVGFDVYARIKDGRVALTSAGRGRGSC